MAHIYVSHVSQDTKFADQLAVQLQQRGLVIQPVPNPMALSAERDTNPKWLDTASHVLAVLSAASVASDEILHDWEQALDQNKCLIMVFYQTCIVPPRLQSLPLVDFRGQFLMAVEDLIGELKKAHAPTRPITVEYPAPVANPDLLPGILPAERCWREDRLRINYHLPIIMASQELATRLLPFLNDTYFVLIESNPLMIKSKRLRRFRLFDPRRAEHTLTVQILEGALLAYYEMTRMQVFYWLAAHYHVLDREAAALYRHLATGHTHPGSLEPVQKQARVARFYSWALLVVIALAVLFVVRLIAT